MQPIGAALDADETSIVATSDQLTAVNVDCGAAVTSTEASPTNSLAATHTSSSVHLQCILVKKKCLESE